MLLLPQVVLLHPEGCELVGRGGGQDRGEGRLHAEQQQSQGPHPTSGHRDSRALPGSWCVVMHGWLQKIKTRFICGCGIAS